MTSVGTDETGPLHLPPNVQFIVQRRSVKILHERPLAAIHLHLGMLRCGPSKQPFVLSAALCRPKRRCAYKPDFYWRSFRPRRKPSQLQHACRCYTAQVVLSQRFFLKNFVLRRPKIRPLECQIIHNLVTQEKTFGNLTSKCVGRRTKF